MLRTVDLMDLVDLAGLCERPSFLGNPLVVLDTPAGPPDPPGRLDLANSLSLRLRRTAPPMPGTPLAPTGASPPRRRAPRRVGHWTRTWTLPLMTGRFLPPSIKTSMACVDKERRGRCEAERSMIAVGVDVAEERKGLDLVALDAGRRAARCEGMLTVDDLVRIVLNDLQPTIVCIDSPSGWSTSSKSRLAERELHQRGINVFFAPSDPGDHPFYRWIRVGISIYEALSATYPLFRGGPPAGTAAEVFPHASATLLAGEVPPHR